MYSMYRLFQLEIVDKKIQINYNHNLGHKIGQCQLSPNGKFNFIHIPKNASTSMKMLLKDWKFTDYNNLTNVENLVILRDPTERWISGIAEFLTDNYINNNINNSEDEITKLMHSKIFQNILFNFVIFDDHTLPQCYYLQGLQLSDITFFYHNDQTLNKIKDYINIEGQTSYSNTSTSNKNKKIIKNILQNLIKNNKDLQHRIDVHYYADHQLFDLVKFY